MSSDTHWVPHIRTVASGPAVQSIAAQTSNPGEITFFLPRAEETALTLYNVRGQKIAELKKGNLPEGWHFARVDGNQLTSGVYIYQLKAGNTVKSLKLAK
jgi:hypothetical protein